MEPRRCRWCRSGIAATARSDAQYCSKKCRQTAFRLRRRRERQVKAAAVGLRLAYADPPYPGLAARYYRNEPTFAGEVDHEALMPSLQEYDGWAISTSARYLGDLLRLCPREARVCAWVKPHGANPNTLGIHNCWEPLIVKPARLSRPGRRDWLRAHAARGGGPSHRSTVRATRTKTVILMHAW